MFGQGNGMFVERVDHHGGPSAFAWTIFALLLVLLLIALVSLVLDFYYRSKSDAPGGTLAVLDERYARGEITREAYLQARVDLGGKPPVDEAPTEVAAPPAPRKQAPPAPAT